MSGTAMADDGSAVEIFRRLPASPDLDLIADLLGPNSSVLDLGAGAGRLADPLAELGHAVTAVDESADMLAHVRHARTVRARIEELRLPDRFDAIVMAGGLLNYLGADLRHGALATAAYHLKPTGTAIIGWLSPQWFDRHQVGHYRMVSGSTVQTMTIHAAGDGRTAGEFTLECDGQRWSQAFEFGYLSVADLMDELDSVGLDLDTPAPESTEWLQASRRRT